MGDRLGSRILGLVHKVVELRLGECPSPDEYWPDMLNQGQGISRQQPLLPLLLVPRAQQPLSYYSRQRLIWVSRHP